MKKPSLIGHVVDAYTLCRKTMDPADQVIGPFYRNRRYLGAADRRFISRCVFGMLRHHRLLESYYAGLVLPGKSADAPSTLVLYCIFAARVRGEGLESLREDIAPLWPHASSLPDLNLMLTRIQTVEPTPETSTDTGCRIGVRHSHPDFVVEQWMRTYGEIETEKLCFAMNEEAPTTIRVNTLRTSVEICQDALHREGVETERTRFSPVGLVLKKRTNIGGLRSFREGWFEIQDEGSQLIGFLVHAGPGMTVVDACAGAGGKSLFLACTMNNRGAIHAWDPIASRLLKIKPRAKRAGAEIIRVQNGADNNVSELLGSVDRLLIDAPCSGSGTFRRNPGLKATLVPEDVHRMARLQKSILSKYDRLLRPGGILVYSTCSLLKEENEDIVNWFLSSHPEYSLLKSTDILNQIGILTDSDEMFLQLFPHRQGTDGFFAAVLKRNDSVPGDVAGKFRRNASQPPPSGLS